MDNKILADVCNGLSEVCIMLSKQKQEDEKLMREKLMVMRDYNSDNKNREVIKSLMRKKRDNHKKYAEEFKKKAKIFTALAKLHKIKSKEVKNGKNKIQI